MTRVSVYTIDDHVTIWLDGRYHCYVIRHQYAIVLMALLVWLYAKSRIRLLYDYIRSTR